MPQANIFRQPLPSAGSQQIFTALLLHVYGGPVGRSRKPIVAPVSCADLSDRFNSALTPGDLEFVRQHLVRDLVELDHVPPRSVPACGGGRFSDWPNLVPVPGKKDELIVSNSALAQPVSDCRETAARQAGSFIHD